MHILKKREGRTAVIVAGLIILYLVTRLTNLTLLPIFTDEAIYVRWAQIGSRDANWRFISLVDGKQPLYTWIAMVFMRFIEDPLMAGRLVSVLAGLFTTAGIWVTAKELFRSQKVAIAASLLYILIPFGLMYDRMALYDSLSAAISVWSLYLSILLVRRLSLDVALLLGMSLGLGMLNKTSGFLSLYLLPVTVLLKPKRLLPWIFYVCVAAVLSMAIYSILRLSPLFAMIGQKDTVFIYSFSEWLTHPFNFLFGNIRGLFHWAIGYLTWPVYLVAILAGLSIWKFTREKLLLLVWWFAPFFALALTGRVLYPRFILFMVMPLIILAGVGLVWILQRLKGLTRVVVIGLLFVTSLYTDFYIITNPLYAPIPNADAGQYIDDWPSGWGVPEVNAFLAREAQKGKVSVYTDGTFGLLPYAIEIYLVDHPNMTIRGLYPITADMPPAMMADARDHPTYMVFNATQKIPPWPLTFIDQYQKGKRSDVFLRLYRVEPPSL